MSRYFVILSAVLAMAVTACAGPDVITLSPADGKTVIADRYSSGSHAVILAHGGRFDRHSWAREATQIAAAGIAQAQYMFESVHAERVMQEILAFQEES